MITTPELSSFSVQISNFINGALAKYTIKIISPLPLNTGDVLKIEFPSHIILPPGVTCTALGAISAISCSNVGSILTASFTFPGDVINAGSEILFQVNNVKNPPDTRPRLENPFKNIVFSEKTTNSVPGLILTKYTKLDQYVLTTTFGTIITPYSLSQSLKGFGK